MSYEVQTFANLNGTKNNTIIKTDDDGKVYFIPADPANSDYQAYLATLAANSATTAQ